jgi:acetyltransferase-like isoleucine patch superfamily enzyme
MTQRKRGFNRATAPHLVQCALNLIRSKVQTPIARGLAWWWNVELGPGCRFYGMPTFRLLPGSSVKIGPNCEFRSTKWSNMAGIQRPCIISCHTQNAKVEIGRDCGMSATIIGCAVHVKIGDRVMCGANASIIDTDWHPIDWRDRQTSRPAYRVPVVIGDDVWIGMGAMILKGVEIGPRSVIGAGSIVTKSIPADVVAAGNPAVVVRNLPADQEELDRERQRYMVNAV